MVLGAFSFQQNTHNAEVLRLLSAFPLFRSLGEALKPLSLAGSVRKVRQGTSLFHAGQRADQLVLVLSGLLKIVRHTDDGSEVILGLFGAREPVGLLAVLQGGNHETSAVVLSKQASVLCLPGPALLDVLRRDAASMLALNQALLCQLQLLNETIDVLSAGSVSQRLAALLLSLAERFGDEMEDGTVSIPTRLSRGELSSLINARSETTIRQLTRWRAEGILETTPEGFVIQDPGRLAEILGGKPGQA